jgi:hypothetical protein
MPSISNNSLKQVAILITLAKTQNFFSNNSSNQLAIYPHLEHLQQLEKNHLVNLEF